MVIGPTTTTRNWVIEEEKLEPPQPFAQPMPMRATATPTIAKAGR